MNYIMLDEYQERAQETDQDPKGSENGLIIPLLGLAGEAGTLLSEYKKLLRDGEAHARFNEQVQEDLGDILWYVANVATKCDLKLSEVAQRNLKKTRERFLPPEDPPSFFDEGFPLEEQLPRTFEFTLASQEIEGESKIVLLASDGNQVGNPLTDNAYVNDGYRFHDVFHLAYAAVLGWSPVTRRILGKKRRGNVKVDEVEDGGRARAVEEGIAAFVHEYASRHEMLDGINRIDWHVLSSIQRLTQNFEVAVRTAAEWERAILMGYDAWRNINENNGGKVRGSLPERSLMLVLK